jgi:hypothetical protein
MKQANVIETSATVVEPEPAPPAGNSQQMAVQRYENAGAVGKAMTVDELHTRLEFVREVMRKEMQEGQDYGKIPGAGEKPTLLQPGAQKLLMVFNLTAEVKREVLREFPGMPMHREYEFTITVRAPNGKEWDGVGTCSTLESKYRWRKAERKCPQCGQNAIIMGKAEYGGGFVCWKKKGGCDSKFAGNDERITSQPTDRTENEDPADQWNTVRKMAFKRGLVHGAINATNTSELWTQDMEDNADGGSAPAKPASKPKSAGTAAARRQQAPPQQQPAAPAAAPAAAKAPLYPSPEGRVKMIAALKAGKMEERALEYFRKIDGALLPNETLESLPLQFVPASTRQMFLLNKAVQAFDNGQPAVLAFRNALKPEEPKPAPKKEDKTQPELPAAKKPEKPIEVPRDENPDPNSPSAPWRSFPIPFGPHAGITLANVDKKVLFGFWANWQPSPTWKGRDNVERPTKPENLARDKKFRAMIDEAGKHYNFVHPDAEPDPQDGEDEHDHGGAPSGTGSPEGEDGSKEVLLPEEDDVPF